MRFSWNLGQVSVLQTLSHKLSVNVNRLVNVLDKTLRCPRMDWIFLEIVAFAMVHPGFMIKKYNCCKMSEKGPGERTTLKMQIIPLAEDLSPLAKKRKMDRKVRALMFVSSNYFYMWKLTNCLYFNN